MIQKKKTAIIGMKNEIKRYFAVSTISAFTPNFVYMF